MPRSLYVIENINDLLVSYILLSVMSVDGSL
jgi:hypothetical protein